MMSKAGLVTIGHFQFWILILKNDNVLSWEEVSSTCLKALRAIGLPHGLDHDAAANAIWLEARGLNGLADLCDEIQKYRLGLSWNVSLFRQKEKVWILKNTPCTSLVLAPTAIDLISEKGQIIIESCDLPTFIFAEAARRSIDGTDIWISWSHNGSTHLAKCQNGTMFLSQAIRNINTPLDITISLYNPISITHPEEILTWSTNLAARRKIFASKEWRLILLYSNRILVPGSPRSRSSAGPEVDDNY